MTAAVLVAVITVLPLVVVAADGFGSSPAGALEYLIRPRTAELLTNTLLLLLVTVPATIVLGVGAAWLVERTDLPLAGVWRVLLGAPLAVPAFVAAYAWVSFRPGLDGLGGAALVTTAAYFPFVYLPVAAILRDLDAAPEEDARARMRAQVSDEERLDAADVVIDNNGPLEALESQADELVRRINDL